ncbi:MAG: cytochrome b/b6 domain-containing protein [Thermoplasmata archaeon]|nr:cytochrome b/b6 domain-containing protein [Thermoplasmata archaeon]
MRRFILAFIIFCLLATVAAAWNDCPYDRVNDPYPGLCRRYVDTNRDGYCDHSQISATASTEPIDVGEEDTGTEEPDALKQSILGTNTYHIIPMMIIFSILYAVTYAFSKKGIINIADHRKIWNWALLATFLIAGILGLILAACINYGWTVPFSTTTLLIHVDIGIAMSVISVFHILWHWNYWKGKNEQRDCEKPKRKMRN